MRERASGAFERGHGGPRPATRRIDGEHVRDERVVSANSVAAATSSGVPTRPTGAWPRIGEHLVAARGAEPIQKAPESTMPGETTLTRTGAISSASRERMPRCAVDQARDRLPGVGRAAGSRET